MKKGILFGIILVAFLCGILCADSGGDAILGQWYTANDKSVVEVYKCGEEYCGKIVWLKEPLNKEGKEKLDVHNPDESLRSRKIMGLEVLKGLKYKGDNKWEGGKIYDPEKGKTYKCKAKLEGNELKLRGYIGFSLIGRTTVWRRK